MKAFAAIVAVLFSALSIAEENVADVRVNKEDSNVVQLDEQNFDHLTQASRGSTSGPWFIKFYAPWCSHCRHMTPAWEQIATELKGVVNVADIDATRNPNIAKRFDIKGYPTLILLNKGMMYHYKGGDRSAERLAAFATVEYENAPSVPIPAPLTYLGIAKEYVISGVTESRRIFEVAFRGFMVISTFSFLFGIVFGMMLCVVLLTRGRRAAHAAKATKISARKQD